MPARKKIFGLKFLSPLILVFLFLVVFRQTSCYGTSSGDVVINEVMWMGSSKSSKDEWIELRNNTDQKIQLKGWQIENLLRSNGTFVFPDEPTIEIEGKSFFLVSYYSKIDGIVDGVSVLDHKGLVWRCNGHPSCASFSLANSNNGDLVLRDNDGKEIDRVPNDSWPAGKKEDNAGYSMERINPLFNGSDSGNWATATEAKNLISGVLDKGTPESENSVFSSSPTLAPTPASSPSPTNTPMPTNTPTPEDSSEPTATQTETSYPSDIYISEFMANPETGDDEWVEIYNGNSEEVVLTDWDIDDKAGESKPPKSFSATITADGYTVVVFDSGTFHNSGDDVRLINPDNEEVDSKSYSETTKGKSWSKDSSGNWCQVDPTKGESNSSCPSSDSSPTSTPTSTPTPILTKTPTPTEKLSLTPTPDAFGDVLGATEAGSSDFSENETSNEYEKDSDLKPPVLWPKLLIGLGLMLIFGAAYPLWLPKLKIVYNRIKRNK